MSVIVAKATTCCSGTSTVSYECYPAVAVQRVIPVGSTLAVDGIPTTGFKGGKWYVMVSTTSGSRIQTYELAAAHKNASSASFVQYGVVGSSVANIPSVTTIGGVLSLNIQNTDTEDLIVYVTRLSLPSDTSQTNVLDTVEIGAARNLIRPTSSSTVDFLPATKFKAVKWLVTITDQSGNRHSSQIYAQFVGGVYVLEYGKYGDQIDFDVLVTEVVGYGVELALVNNTSSMLRVELTRIPIQTGTMVNSCGPSNGVSLWLPTQTTIAATATGVVDTVPTASHSLCKWLLYASTPTASMMSEVVALARPSSSPLVTRYAMLLDRINIEVTASQVVDNMVLSITNNTSSSLSVNLLRVPVAA